MPVRRKFPFEIGGLHALPYHLTCPKKYASSRSLRLPPHSPTFPFAFRNLGRYAIYVFQRGVDANPLGVFDGYVDSDRRQGYLYQLDFRIGDQAFRAVEINAFFRDALPAGGDLMLVRMGEQRDAIFFLAHAHELWIRAVEFIFAIPIDVVGDLNEFSVRTRGGGIGDRSAVLIWALCPG